MQYLLDTVTIIRHFTANGKIPNNTLEILDNNKNVFYISIISLMEIFYLSEKHRIHIDLNDTIKKIEESLLYRIIDLTTEILLIASDIEFNEIHDRLILASAKWLDIPVISSDKKFNEVRDIQVIWE